jgi:Carboxypeptidase regulatory-like domain/TonB dependent receptor/TonB-dependent Receptor Plug Domain
MRFRTLRAWLLALAVALPAAAQEQSGSIQGVVKDPQGAVLPGATVDARNQGTGANVSVTTDGHGVYRFPALPSGSYEIAAALAGFKSAKPAVAILELGKNLTIDIVLSLASVSEAVTVTAESSPLIDVKTNATYVSIGKDTIERMPRGRDFPTILRQAPGAQQESKAGSCGAGCAIQMDGASGSENRFIIDGMDTTNLQTGVSGKVMLLDFVDEVQVKSSGYNAEFGGATGGVINVLTKSGSNQYHGTIGSYFTNDSWDGNRRPSARFNPFDSNVAETDLVTRDDGQQYYSPVADVGGPIFRQKVWFYGGVAYTKTNNQRDAIFRTDITKTNRHFEWWSDAKYFNYNVTSQLTNNLRVKFAGSNQRDASRGTAPALQPDNALPIPANSVYPSGVPSLGVTTATFDANPDGSINQAAFDSRWVRQGDNRLNDTYSANVDWMIRPNFFVNVSGGSYNTDFTTPEEFRGNQIRHIFNNANSDSTMLAAGFPTVPVQFQQPNGYTNNISSNGRVRDIFTRRFVNANATWFKSLFGGQHVFKTGLRFERFANDVLFGNAQPIINVEWGKRYVDTNGVTHAGTYGYYFVNQTGTIGEVHSNNYAFWIQDSWDVNRRLTLNLGVRAENEYVPSYKDQTEFPDALDIKFGFKDKIAPRLGFAYDVKGDGKWKAFGSYGWYYDITKLELPRGSFGGDHWVNYYWTLDTADFNSIQCGEGPSGCPGRYIESVDFRHSSNQIDPGFEAYFNRPGMTGIDPNLKPVKQGEWTAGLEHELTPTMSLGARYVHKWLFRTIEDVGVFFQGSEIYLISNPGEGLAVEMEPSVPNLITPKPVRKYDSIELRLNKRFSNRWFGTASYQWSRLFGNYGGLASSDENGRTSPNVNRYYDNTVMSYDANGDPVYGRLQTDRPHVFKLSGAYEFKWGTMLGANWFVESGIPQSTSFRFSGFPVFPNGRGDLGRTPVLSQLDLNVTQEFRLLGHSRIQLQANIDNVFDQMTWTNYFLTITQGPSPYRDSLTVANPPALSLYGANGSYDLQQRIAAYTGTMRVNPFYHTPNVFQGRREMRVLARLTF